MRNGPDVFHLDQIEPVAIVDNGAIKEKTAELEGDRMLVHLVSRVMAKLYLLDVDVRKPLHSSQEHANLHDKVGRCSVFCEKLDVVHVW